MTGSEETNPYYRLFLKAPGGIVVLRGPHHVFEFVNERAAQLIGRETIGKPLREVMPEVLAQPLFDRLDEAYRTGEPYVGYEASAQLREAGKEAPSDVFLNIIYQPTRDDGGDVDGIIVHAIEVTQHVRARQEAEEERRKLSGVAEAHHMLAEACASMSSTLDLKATLEAIPRLTVPRFASCCAVYLEADPGGPIVLTAMTHADPAVTARIRAAWMGRSLASLGPSHPFARAVEAEVAMIHEDAAGAMFDDGSGDAATAALAQALRLSSWMIVPLKAHRSVFGLIAFGAAAGSRSYAPEDLALATELGRRAAIAIDHAQLFEAARRERARAEEVSRSKDEFLALLSHELRTPLTAMLGWISMLRSGVLSDEKRRRALDTVERNARAQQQLIEDLLDVSRIVGGKLRLDVGPVDACRSVEAALDVIRPAAAARSIRVTADLDRRAGSILGDPDRLQQVFWNLLTNAVKFTSEGGRVRVSLRRDGAHVVAEVSDNGQGIRAEFLPHVFDRFRQADASITRTHGGLGLGLSIVRHLVELHGGTITATSEGEGRGAAFTVRLPASPSARARPPRAPSQPALDVVEPLFGSSALADVSVLVVDDEDDARDLLVTVLAQCKAEVSAASSVDEALVSLQRTAPHVIVSDIGMPDEDGYSLIRRVRSLADRDLAETPAVALTAYARAEDRTRAILEGFNIHVPKPIEPSELIAVVQSLTGRIPIQRLPG